MERVRRRVGGGGSGEWGGGRGGGRRGARGGGERGEGGAGGRLEQERSQEGVVGGWDGRPFGDVDVEKRLPFGDGLGAVAVGVEAIEEDESLNRGRVEIVE